MVGGNYPAMNFVGDEWHRLKEWLEGERLDCYQRLSNTKATEAETQQLRGRVSLLDQMLSWPNIVAATYRPRS
jgi:hypothetical protein